MHVTVLTIYWALFMQKYLSINLYVVRTPLQLFNAIEARGRFHHDDKNILIIYYKNNIDLNMCRTLLDDTWYETHEYYFKNMQQLFYPIFINRLIKYYRVEYLYIGLVSNIPLHIANLKNPQNLVILDDGNETLLIAAYIEKLKKITSIKNKLNIKNIILGRLVNKDILKKAHYFSIYYPKEVNRKIIVHNDYRDFKLKCKNIKTSQQVIFIGSNLVDNYLSKNTLLAIMFSVKKYYKDTVVYYCPHRYETDEFLSEIDMMGFCVVRYNTILESAFYQANSKPKEVATLRSTAIDTLSELYGIRSKVFSFDLSLLSNVDKKDEFNNLYLDYKKRKIDVQYLDVIS